VDRESEGNSTYDRSIEIIFSMWDAGIAAFRRWDPEEEDVEALVAGIFMSMWEACPVNRVGGQFCANGSLKPNDTR
jgi:hypothetical protein